MTGMEDQRGGLVRCALVEVAHHDDVAVVLEHVDGVLDRLLIEVAGTRHLGVGEAGHGAAEAMHGGLMSEAGAGRRLVERRHHRLVLEEIGVATLASNGLEAVGDLEEVEELVPFEVLQ